MFYRFEAVTSTLVVASYFAVLIASSCILLYFTGFHVDVACCVLHVDVACCVLHVDVAC